MDVQWDVIAISAMDNDQKAAFEKQLRLLLASRFAKSVRVYGDEPDGVKIGGGGATLSIIHRLHSEFCQSFFGFRILLIHAGGYSQRQPNASVLGKLFIPIPIKTADDHRRPSTLLEMKLRSYSALLHRMDPGIFLAASDTLEHLGDPKRLSNDISWRLDGNGFVALAHPSSLDIGRQHGVYVLDQDHLEVDISKAEVFEASCRRVLQKPSAEQMRREGAILTPKGAQSEELVYTDSAYYMSANVVKKLLEVYDHLSPLSCELDCYGDFLQPLGSEATDGYLREKAVNALVQNDQLATARRYIFDTFRNLPLKLLVFPKSRFYHLGTFKELLGYFCGKDGHDFRSDFGTENVVFSSVPTTPVPTSACVTCSLIGGQFVIGDSSELLFEYCRFPAGFQFSAVGGQCILSNCSSKNPVVIPVSVFMMTSPVGHVTSPKYITVVFGIRDDLKAVLSESGDNFFASQLLEKSVNDRQSIFDEQLPRSLWHARLFPAFGNIETSFDWTIKWLQAVVNGEEVDGLKMDEDGGRFYSLHDLVLEKNVDSLLSYRSSLQDEIEALLAKFGKM